MNKIQIIGNIGKDAIINQVNDKKSIHFNVAVNEYYKDKNGSKVEKTDWYSCTAWRNSDQSTEIAKYLKSGTKVYIEGRPKADYYANKDTGEIIASINISVQNIELLSGKKDD